MSGLKLFCPTYSSHCCMYLFGKIVLKFCLFLFDMIWNWCAKWYMSWKTLSKYIILKYEHIWEVSYSRPFLSTHLSIRSVFLIKLFIKIEAFCLTHYWICVFVCTTYHTPYVYVYPQHTPSCTWMSRTRPPWSSSLGISVRSSPSSPVQWSRHFCAWLFVQWSN